MVVPVILGVVVVLGVIMVVVLGVIVVVVLGVIVVVMLGVIVVVVLGVIVVVMLGVIVVVVLGVIVVVMLGVIVVVVLGVIVVVVLSVIVVVMLSVIVMMMWIHIEQLDSCQHRLDHELWPCLLDLGKVLLFEWHACAEVEIRFRKGDHLLRGRAKAVRIAAFRHHGVDGDMLPANSFHNGGLRQHAHENANARFARSFDVGSIRAVGAVRFHLGAAAFTTTALAEKKTRQHGED